MVPLSKLCSSMLTYIYKITKLNHKYLETFRVSIKMISYFKDMAFEVHFLFSKEEMYTKLFKRICLQKTCTVPLSSYSCINSTGTIGSRGGLGIRRRLFKMAANLHILEKMN